MSNLVMYAIGIFLLLWLVSAIYTVIISSLHKRNETADLEEMDTEKVRQLLKDKLEYPYCKSIRTNEEGNLDLECKYATYSVKIQDGKLVIKNKFRLFSKASNIIEEKECLEAYLVKILQPEANVNPPKAFSRFKRYIQFRILRRISGLLFLILIILYGLNENGISVTDIVDAWRSKGVSQMCFTDYSEDITIGEALKAACPDYKWSNNKGSDNLYYVTFNGTWADGSLLTIVFETNGKEGSIESVSLNGENITWLQTPFLEIIYENAKSDNRSSYYEAFIKENMEKDTFITESETSALLEEEQQYDAGAQIGGLMADSEQIPIFELGGYYGGIIDAQSVLDFSVYTEDSDNDSIGIVDLYVEGGQYSYNGEVYEISPNLYAVAVDTGEEVLLVAYEDDDNIILQLYVDGEYITEYALMYSYQS